MGKQVTTTYQCLTQSSFEDAEGYQIVTIRSEDIEKIRLWRNAQMDILRQKVIITSQKQLEYFQTHIYPSFNQAEPQQILFSFLHHQACIGYGGLTNIDWEARRAEVSFLVDPERLHDRILYKQDFSHFLALLCQAAFEDLHFHRLFTETFAFRDEHMAILEKCGFKREGVMRDHVYKHGRWYDSILHGKLKGE